LIFLPGLSTAQSVTSVSGRGVGMDVVKTNIEQIGGKVTLQSQLGAGTTVRMRIPLTLAIMTALVAGSGDEGYAIPPVNVIELLHVHADDDDTRIETLGNAAVYLLRGELLPLVDLAAELSRDRLPWWAERAGRTGAITIAVLQAEGRKFGLI